MTIGHLWLPSLSASSTALFIQQAAQNSGGTGTNTISIQNQTAQGNVIIGVIGLYANGINGATISSVTDSQSNTWAVDRNSSFGTTNPIGTSIIRGKLTKALSTSDTVSVTMSNGSVQFVACQLLEFNGNRFTATPADVGQDHPIGTSGTSNTCGPTSTLATSNELVVTGATRGGAASATTWTIPTGGYTEVPQGVTNNVSDAAYKTVNVNTAITVTWGWTPSNGSSTAIMTYKLAN